MVRILIFSLSLLFCPYLSAQTNPPASTNSVTNSIFPPISTPTLNQMEKWSSGALSNAQGTVERTIHSMETNVTSTNSGTNSIFSNFHAPTMNQVNQWSSNLLTTTKESFDKAVDAIAASGLLGSPEQSRVDRLLIPNADQGEFGNRSGNCIPNAFSHFVVWWDSEGFLPLSKKFPTTNAKFEWVQEQLEKAFKTQYFGTEGKELTKGMENFFKTNYEGRAKVRTLVLPITAKNLTAATVGYNATVLCLGVREIGQPEVYHGVTLVEATPDGSISFITWGYRWAGRVVPYPAKNASSKDAHLLKIQLVDDPANPFRNKILHNGLEFIINPETSVLLCAIPTPLTEAEKAAFLEEKKKKQQQEL